MTSNRTNNYSRRVSDVRPIDYSNNVHETDRESHWDTEDVIDLSSTVSGKYEDFNPLETLSDESEYLPLDDYLYQMNPKKPTRFDRTESLLKEEAKSERSMNFPKERSTNCFKERSMDPFKERSTKMQVQLVDDHLTETFESKAEITPIGTVSVKCTPSSPAIVGTPSQVAIKLNEAIQRYIPRRNSLLQNEINQEVDVIENDEIKSNTAREPEDLEEEEDKEDDYWCPGDLNLDVNTCDTPEYKYCPGTRDLLSGKKMPCSKARVLREIALGRRMPRRYLPPRVPDEEYEDDEEDEELPIMNDLQDLSEYLEKIGKEEDDGDWSCAKGGEGKRGSQAKIKKPDFGTRRKKPCCAPRTGNKTSKCVSFAK